MSSPISYKGKLNYSPYATNENIYFVFYDGVTPRKSAGVFGTWTWTDDPSASEKNKVPFVYPQLLIIKEDEEYTIGSKDDYYNFRVSFAEDLATGTVKLFNTSGKHLATIEITRLKND